MLKLGVTINEFWDMTPAEMYEFTSAKQELIEEEQKVKAALIYNLAAITSLFVNLGLNGKQLPAISEVFPSMFTAEDVSDLLMIAYRLLFEAYAIRHNKLRAKKGLTNDT